MWSGMSSSRRDSSAMKKKGFCCDTVQLMNSYLLLGLPTLFNRLVCWGWRKETLQRQTELITELQVHTHANKHTSMAW